MWGVSPQPLPVCSIHLDDATAATEQRHQCAHHTPATGGEERESEPIKCMHSPHTSYRWRGERVRANQVDALTTHQLQVERRESQSQSSVRSPHTSYRWIGERIIATIKCMRSPHTSQLQVERRESHRANQVYALTTHQLQLERIES